MYKRQPARIAARTGAALMPAYCRRTGHGFDIYFEDPLEIRDSGNSKEDAVTNTCMLLKRIETWIASDPGQWMVLDRIWRPVKQKPRLRGKVLTRSASS